LANLHIIKAGWQSTIQDLGRQGYFRSGLSEGGALDEIAFRWANALLNNPANSACIEILMGDFEAEFELATSIAITGADLTCTINGKSIENWQSLKVKAGDRIRFNSPITGLRAYLAIAGGWQTPIQFGSRSTVLREKLGGIDGEKLKIGQKLSYLANPDTPLQKLDSQLIPKYTDELTLKVLPSYQYDLFSETAKRRFFTSEYSVSQRIDRMGYRLEGPEVMADNQQLISEGIALGAIQVPPDGQPIVLLKDRQTIGGYPKLGCVASLDCSLLSQRAPGSEVKFELSDMPTVQIERRMFLRLIYQF
jgi:biotin-dependent carboxylase-like uncharacterized protein